MDWKLKKYPMYCGGIKQAYPSIRPGMPFLSRSAVVGNIIFNSTVYILSRAGEEGAERKLLSAGANRVVSPYLMGAARMVNAILRPTIVEFVDLVVDRKHLELQLEEITVADASRFKGKPLRESGLRRELGLIVVAIKKASGDMLFNPSSETLIEKGDVLIVLGEKKHLGMLEQLVQSAEMLPAEQP